MELEGRLLANHDRIVGLLRSTQREGIEDLIKWLEESDYFYAPASAKYHCSYAGGLAQHSLNVLDQLTKLLHTYTEIDFTPESAIISALLHDICKVNFYTVEQRNRKNESGQWEKYDCYSIKEKFHYGGHAQKSVFLAQQFVKLTIDEAVAINNHMSFSQGDSRDVGGAYEQFPFAWLLSVADQAATFLMEKDT